jgi:hypothetical protein
VTQGRSEADLVLLGSLKRQTRVVDIAMVECRFAQQ